MKRAPSFSHQHSILELHSHVKARHAHVEEPPCCAKMCMCFLMLLLLAMVLASIGTGVWAIILWSDLSETNCKKLANIVGNYGFAVVFKFVIHCGLACMRKKAEHGEDDHKHKVGETSLSCLAFISMCFGFAIVTGNPPDAWGDGATSKERCDPDGDVFPQMATLFIMAFTIDMTMVFLFCCALCTGAVKPDGQPAIHPGGG